MDRTLNLLKSITTSGYWTKEMPAARCDPQWAAHYHDNPSPSIGCACGYWSMKPEMLETPNKWHWPTWTPEAVIGVGIAGFIEQWGVVDEYEMGYRSQYARVTSIIDFSMDWWSTNCYLDSGWAEAGALEGMLARYSRRVEAVSQKYQVPVVLHG